MARPGRQSTIYGDSSTSDGRGIVTTLESGPIGLVDKAGIDPQQLDQAVLNLISMVDGGSALILDNAPMVQKLMKRLQLEVDRAIAAMEQIDAQAARMLGDARARRLYWDFHRQWLGLDRILGDEHLVRTPEVDARSTSPRC